MGLISNRKDIHSELDLVRMVSRALRDGSRPTVGESDHTKLMLQRGYAVLAQSEQTKPAG